MSTATASHDEHAHRPVWHYLAIAAFLTLLTFIEIGPLFEWFNLPVPALMALSVVKFAVVAALFMHLADDAPIYTQIFVIPLLGAGAMVFVLMLLFGGVAPSPHDDSLPVQERQWVTYSGECTSWLRSHVSNKWYCASPPISEARMLAYNAPDPGAAPKAPKLELAGMSEAEAKTALVEAGKGLYEANCQVCHQPNGAGIPGAFPPLANSDYIDDPVLHARVIVHGLNGEIVVNGTTYNGAMQAFGNLSDNDIAAIATYERNAWGNDMGVVMPEQVASVR